MTEVKFENVLSFVTMKPTPRRPTFCIGFIFGQILHPLIRIRPDSENTLFGTALLITVNLHSFDLN